MPANTMQTRSMSEMEAIVKAQAKDHLAFCERVARERLGARFDTDSVFMLDGGGDVRQMSDRWLSLHATRSWDANQIDDLRKCNLMLARRYAIRASIVPATGATS